MRPSLTYFELELVSFSGLCDVVIDPPFYVFANSLSVGKIGKRLFTITNPSECNLNFDVRTMFQTSDAVMSHVSKTSGTLLAKQEV